jgi:alpha-L-fucosidase
MPDESAGRRLRLSIPSGVARFDARTTMRWMPVALAVLLLPALAGEPSPPAASAQASSAPSSVPATALARWQDMRFGMFVHWGPVSLTGREIGWSRGDPTPLDEYDRLYERFNPVAFNADEWVRAAKAAGMKYLVFTSKHHDGFSMWNTRQSPYNIMRSPFGRDVVRELAEACRRGGLMFGVYYSILDWHHPDYPLGSPAGRSKKPAADMDRYVDFVKNQLAELVKGYGPLGVLWFDGEWEDPWTEERGNDLYAFLRRLQPSLLINNRVSKARKGMAGTSAAGRFSGDYDTPEQRVGGFNMDRPWESCITICQQWAWKPDDTMKSLQESIRTLVGTAGGDGNLLFNVGPMPDGRIEPRQVARLAEMGAWLKRHGEAIYSTRGGPFMPGPWGASTRRANRVYIHAFAWDGDILRLPSIPAKVLSARLLGGGAVDLAQDTLAITLRVSQARQDPIDTVVVLQLDRPARELAPVPMPVSSR